MFIFTTMIGNFSRRNFEQNQLGKPRTSAASSGLIIHQKMQCPEGEGPGAEIGPDSNSTNSEGLTQMTDLPQLPQSNAPSEPVRDSLTELIPRDPEGSASRSCPNHFGVSRTTSQVRASEGSWGARKPGTRPPIRKSLRSQHPLTTWPLRGERATDSANPGRPSRNAQGKSEFQHVDPEPADCYHR